jgi:hypothetical protein
MDSFALMSHVRIAVLVTLSAAGLASHATDPVYSITGHVISNGSSVHSTSNCYQLDAVIAEPVVELSSGGIYEFDTGFAATSPLVTDTIFANAFEDCSP